MAASESRGLAVASDECLLCLHNRSYKAQVVAQLNNRIALFRAERGVSRRELAGAVGVNPQTIGYLERGDYSPSCELALKIADFFGVPVEALFSLRPFRPLAEALGAARGEN